MAKYSTFAEETRFRQRISALSRVFAKTDRILTGRREVTVKMALSKDSGVPAPGFSDGQNIVINYDRIPDVKKAVGLVRLSAVNYHELSHLLFTPRDHGFRQRIRGANAMLAFNILEDQRIETLFVAKYRPASKYFTEMNVQLFLKNEKAWPTAFFYTHGRRYMPLEIRQELESAFAGTPQQMEDAKKIIDEYRLLAMTTATDLNRGFVLACNLRDIMQSLKDDGHQIESKGNEDGTGTCTDHDHDGTMDRRLAEDASEQSREDTEKQDEQEAEGDDGSGFWEDVEDDDDTEDDDDESASGEADDDDEEDGDDGDDLDGEGDGPDWDEDGDEADDGDEEDGDAEGDSDSDRSSDRGNGGKQHGDAVAEEVASLDPGELRDLINEVLEAISDSEDVKNDIRQINSAVAEAAMELDEESMPGRMRPATADEMTAMLRTEQEYKRLFAQVEPGWNYGSDHGRLNVQRAIEASSSPYFDAEELFDEWDEGREDEVGVEAFLSLDLSGSMGYVADQASAAMWVIKRPLDAIEANVSVVGFHSTTFTLYNRFEKASAHEVQSYVADGGNTIPAHSMKVARRIMETTDRPNRLFVIITDGEWAEYDYELDAIEAENTDGVEKSGSTYFASVDYNELLNSIDAVRVFIGIGGAHNAYPEAFHHSFDVYNVNEIPEKIRSVVGTMLGNVIQSRRH